jgi:hypothetical protein
MEELAPPEEALIDPNSVELLRAWLSDEQLIITLQSMDFPAGAVTYGMVCADIARHAADRRWPRFSGFSSTSARIDGCGGSQPPIPRAGRDVAKHYNHRPHRLRLVIDRGDDLQTDGGIAGSDIKCVSIARKR